MFSSINFLQQVQVYWNVVKPPNLQSRSEKPRTKNLIKSIKWRFLFHFCFLYTKTHRNIAKNFISQWKTEINSRFFLNTIWWVFVRFLVFLLPGLLVLLCWIFWRNQTLTLRFIHFESQNIFAWKVFIKGT